MISTTFVHNVRPLSLFPAQLHSADGTGGWHDPLFDYSVFVSNFFKWVLCPFVCVCKKWVCLAEGRCWNHSSSLYNTMPRLTRFGGQGSGVHYQVINRSKFPDYETQGHLGQAQDAERIAALIIAGLAQNSVLPLCTRFHICVPTWLQILLQIIHAVADLTPLNYRMYPLLQWRREKSVARIFRILEFRDLCGN